MKMKNRTYNYTHSERLINFEASSYSLFSQLFCRPAKFFIQEQYENKQLVYIDLHKVPEKEVFSERLRQFQEELKELADLKHTLLISERVFSGKRYLFKRIEDLIELFESEENDEISLESLKSMLLFLFDLRKFEKPRLTLNENGTFQLNWQKDKYNLMTLRFKKDDDLDYVIFKPSHYFSKPIILNGSMNVLDFKDYIVTLNLKFHIH